MAEDMNVPLDELRKEFTGRIVNAVDVLTCRSSDSYAEYKNQRVSAGELLQDYRMPDASFRHSSLSGRNSSCMLCKRWATEP